MAFYMPVFLCGSVFVIDRFIYSINNMFLYVSTSLRGILMLMYLLTNKKICGFLKELWKSWNTAQKIVLLLMIIINIYILGEIDLFSKFLYFILYLCLNFIIYSLFLKRENENKSE